MILTILLLVLAVPFFAPIFQDSFSENTIPEPPQKEMSATEDIESGIKFADDSTLILDVGDSVALDVIISDESISTNDLIIESVILQGDRQDIVGITADGQQFSITANHPGIVNLSVKTSDGVHQTSITQIIIEDPSANVHNGYSADTFYIINTNSRKIHKSGCSYAPEAGSDNRSVVSSVSSYLKDGYAWCSYCH